MFEVSRQYLISSFVRGYHFVFRVSKVGVVGNCMLKNFSMLFIFCICRFIELFAIPLSCRYFMNLSKSSAICEKSGSYFIILLFSIRSYCCFFISVIYVVKSLLTASVKLINTSSYCFFLLFLIILCFLKISGIIYHIVLVSYYDFLLMYDIYFFVKSLYLFIVFVVKCLIEYRLFSFICINKK